MADLMAGTYTYEALEKNTADSRFQLQRLKLTDRTL